MRHAALLAFALVVAGTIGWGDDAGKLLRADHYVRVKSIVPTIAGQTAQLYVREVSLSETVLRGKAADRVVLFIHGAGTPAEVAFDVPYQDYSWMAFLAQAGYDVFSMDMTGYGRSTRPLVMNDPCNLSAEQQKSLFGSVCKPSHGHNVTTYPSDWHDIGAVVDYLRELRNVEKVSLIGWSMGGPRAGGYAATHPEKVHKLVLLAPGYRRASQVTQPVQLPAAGPVYGTQTRAEFDANWDRQVGCPDQVDPGVRDIVWADMQASDPQAATWGAGARRAPHVSAWGWDETAVKKMKTPALLVAAPHDQQVAPSAVKALYDDLASTEKIYLDIACTSHNALWEKNHLLLFRASLDWLKTGVLQGNRAGVLRMGYH
ncbi:MAG TPA: alpha/beta fold hydrolase [Bryobacteraceae bacterium]|nr:alpha/beta fold hydrolase [Bryobacteraceae bacterium]